MCSMLAQTRYIRLAPNKYYCKVGLAGVCTGQTVARLVKGNLSKAPVGGPVGQFSTIFGHFNNFRPFGRFSTIFVSHHHHTLGKVTETPGPLHAQQLLQAVGLMLNQSTLGHSTRMTLPERTGVVSHALT